MRSFHNNYHYLLESIAVANVNPSVMISMMEDMINMEKVNIETNKLLNNTMAVLQSEYKISHAVMMLSLLRMHDPLAGS